MNPNGNERAELRLPTPVNEAVPASQPAAEALPQAPEMAPAGAEQSAGLAQPVAPQMPAIPLPTTPGGGQVAPPNDVTLTTQSVVPSAADDSDLIEKEWVTKAKEIVERNREDPHLQTQELTLFKADYMKKRYNKTIKLSE